MNYKDETRNAYDTHAQAYAQRTKDFTLLKMRTQLDAFTAALPGKKVLDLGSGPGRDALLLKERGIAVTCVDNSPSMIELCKQKGLTAYQMDFENLPFPPDSFEGVWAFTSLLHVPKNQFPGMLEKIKKVLTPNGTLFIGMREGEGEGYREDAHYPGTRRFVAFYDDYELEQLLKKQFAISQSWRIDAGGKTYLTYLCRLP